MENNKDKVTLSEDKLDQVAGGRERDLGPITCGFNPSCIYVNTEWCQQHLDLCPYVEALN